MAGASEFTEGAIAEKVLVGIQTILANQQKEATTLATLSEKLDEVLAAQAEDAAQDAVVLQKVNDLAAAVAALPAGTIPQSVLDQITDIQAQVDPSTPPVV